MYFKTVNNNNLIAIALRLINVGKVNWRVPCFFSCEEDHSKVKGERVKLGIITGEP